MITQALEGVFEALCLMGNPEPLLTPALRVSATFTNTEETFVVMPDFANAQFYCFVIEHQPLLLLRLGL